LYSVKSIKSKSVTAMDCFSANALMVNPSKRADLFVAGLGIGYAMAGKRTEALKIVLRLLIDTSVLAVLSSLSKALVVALKDLFDIRFSL
jgi:hypothetical protein